MKKLQFECRLLSDVVLNRSAATEGSNSTLDFIPGSNFLGIVAAHYAEFGDRAAYVFHSGHVRFGDAHPVAGDGSMRTLHVPAAMYYPKIGKASETLYLHHHYTRPEEGAQQLKQCRKGFYAFRAGVGIPADTPTSFALKSAHDRDLRRSEDSKMYGYESLNQGLRLQFEVETDDDSLADKITDCLVGTRHIGRSRTAQYGLVEIKKATFRQVEGQLSDSKGPDATRLTTVYADGRLIFLDADGEPTFRPTAEDLGIKDGEIKWEKSQVRTFQYAPWNAKRTSRDADRVGIEKGSVFVVKGGTVIGTGYVGSYRNEGFGKVIYNPAFLEAKAGENGMAVYKLEEEKPQTDTSQQAPQKTDTLLLRYVDRARRARETEEYIYKQVNEFVEKNGGKFRGERFASQWGAIRAIAMQYPKYKDIVYQLFEKEKESRHGKDNKITEEPDAYLTHGVAAEQWKKGNRKGVLENFIKNIHKKEAKYGDIVPEALINLSSEMAKKCKQ